MPPSLPPLPPFMTPGVWCPCVHVHVSPAQVSVGCPCATWAATDHSSEPGSLPLVQPLCPVGTWGRSRGYANAWQAGIVHGPTSRALSHPSACPHEHDAMLEEPPEREVCEWAGADGMEVCSQVSAGVQPEQSACWEAERSCGHAHVSEEPLIHVFYLLWRAPPCSRAGLLQDHRPMSLL